MRAQAGAIAHEVRSLLTAILGDAQAALAESDVPAAVQGNLVEIGRTARHASIVTRQLMAIQRPSDSPSAPLDLRAVVEAMAVTLRPLVDDEIDLRTETGVRPVWIVADAADLEGVVLNLMSNACDAMPSGGILTLKSAVLPGAGGRRAALSVTDTGTGMDLATRTRAFEPYFTTKGPGRGSGLGLASVAAQLKRNGWTIHLETAPDSGSRFTVLIPLAPRADPTG
ncbi:MAG: HAMP domain-containing histidine kinase [Chloroflexota bacterium]|nr:HAMP domain-containing histidine kinase [Chloroflexota bacterium]